MKRTPGGGREVLTPYRARRIPAVDFSPPSRCIGPERMAAMPLANSLAMRCALLVQQFVRGLLIDWSSALHFAEEAVDEVRHPMSCR